MELLERVKRANEVNKQIEELEAQKKELEERIKALNEEKEELYIHLLDYCKEEHVLEEQCGDLFLNYFSKEDVTWLNDEGLLNALKSANLTQFLKTTTKVTIDKNALKKAFKADDALKESYKDFYGTKLIEYVTVTTEENHRKMLEHIEENVK